MFLSPKRGLARIKDFLKVPMIVYAYIVLFHTVTHVKPQCYALFIDQMRVILLVN